MHQDDIKHINKLNRSLILPFIILAISLLFIIALAVFSAKNLDQYARENSKNLINNILTINQTNLGQLITEYAYWNESVEMLVYNRDIQWANTEFVEYLEENYRIEWIFALDLDNKLIYSTHDGEMNRIHPEQLSAGGLQTIISAARNVDFSTDNDATLFSTGIIEVDGKVNIIAAHAFMVYEPTEYDIEKIHGVLIFTKELNTELLTEWSNNYQINDLVLRDKDSTDLADASETYKSIPLTAIDGSELGQLAWMPDKVGSKFINDFMPWILTVIVILVLVSLFFYRRLHLYSNLAYKNIVALDLNREKLAYHAHFDQLTDLPNRILLTDRITHEITACIRKKHISAILYIDLDDFKIINDSMGHQVGDKLLKVVARRLTEITRENDTISRFGGDEFCMLLSDIAEANNAAIIASKILESLKQPFIVEGEEIFIGASIGIVILPDNGQELSILLRYADIAMYRAKSLGKNNYCFYTEQLDRESKQRSKLRSLLYSNREHDEFYLVYQPIYSMKNKRIVSVEALIRWNNQELGDVLPEAFIPIAEDCGLINSIGLWVLEKALSDIKLIHEKTNQKIVLSVNVSVRQFKEPGFCELVLELLDRASIHASFIQFEITESILMSDHGMGADTLFKLADAGISMVLDDFGTGYSSLSYIHHYPIKTLKIDKSFVRGIEIESRNRVLIETIVNMSKNYGMATIAEGIENREQERFIASTGCTFGQGFYFSRPIELEGLCEKILGNSA